MQKRRICSESGNKNNGMGAPNTDKRSDPALHARQTYHDKSHYKYTLTAHRLSTG